MSLIVNHLSKKSTIMKQIAALTMVRNDDFYLKRWTDYYGTELGEEHLYIYLDGKDQDLPYWCPKAHITAVDKIKGQVVSAEKERLAFLSRKAKELLKRGYDLVIGVDADEILIVDPNVGIGLKEYLSGLDIKNSVSGLGVDVGQFLGQEDDIKDDGTPFLNQRKYARLSTRYTKPSVLAAPLQWGSGFHRIKGKNFHIDKNLFLFHFGYFDMRRIEARFADPDRRKAGWTKHIAKRSKTIKQVTKYKAKDWDRMTTLARTLQTIIRPPYAWNKPAMLGLCIIVEIPTRFRDIV